MKTCTRCGKTKPLAEFHVRPLKGGSSYYSDYKECHRLYAKAHYVANRNDYLIKARINGAAARLRAREFVIAYLRDHPCTDCGEGDLVVLQFDHCRGDKEFDVTYMMSIGRSLRAIQAEIAKCDVVCANCHCRRTAARARSWRLTL